ncbi:MAG TPA: LapA family protein [Desulfuromonadales bacterium]|nr:LapA family protein [Desulfuromonadales bacterium]
MKTTRLVFAALLVVVLLVFSVYNSQPVNLSIFDHQSPQLPLFLVLLISFFLGFAAAALWSTMRVTQLRRQIAKMQRETEPRQPEGASGKS